MIDRTKFVGATPGPWHTKREAREIDVWGPDGHFVAEVGDLGHADAHLIAAAPTLLSALDSADLEIQRLRKALDGLFTAVKAAQPFVRVAVFNANEADQKTQALLDKVTEASVRARAAKEKT